MICREGSLFIFIKYMQGKRKGHIHNINLYRIYEIFFTSINIRQDRDQSSFRPSIDVQADAAHLHILNGIIKVALISQNTIMAAGKETHKRQRGSWRRMIDTEAETVEKD